MARTSVKNCSPGDFLQDARRTGSGGAAFTLRPSRRSALELLQPLQIDDGDATIFRADEACLLEAAEGLVAARPGDAREVSDLLLRDPQSRFHPGIQSRMEEARQRVSNLCVDVEHRLRDEPTDELSAAVVQQLDDEVIEGEA